MALAHFDFRCTRSRIWHHGLRLIHWLRLGPIPASLAAFSAMGRWDIRRGQPDVPTADQLALPGIYADSHAALTPSTTVAAKRRKF